VDDHVEDLLDARFAGGSEDEGFDDIVGVDGAGEEVVAGDDMAGHGFAGDGGLVERGLRPRPRGHRPGRVRRRILTRSPTSSEVASA
jgi:hypothetical protein